MSKRETYETRTEEYLTPIVEEIGCSVYDVEYVKEGTDWYLRAYIDKPEGVNINDCEHVSRAMSEILDREDYISDAYIFEVSSPGLGRTLKKEKHFEKSIGEKVEVKTYKPINKQKEFEGILRAYDKDTITIEIESETGSNTEEPAAPEEKNMVLAKSDIALVRLALDF